MIMMTDFTDYSQVSKEEITQAPAKVEWVQAMGSSDYNFPFQLHYILREIEKEGKSDVIAWLPHGRGFRVQDKQRFVNEILPT